MDLYCSTFLSIYGYDDIGTSNDVCLLFYMVGESDQFYIVRKVCDLDCFMYVLLSLISDIATSFVSVY